MLDRRGILIGIIVLVASCLSLSGFAQAQKIGFVNSQQVLYGTEEGKAGLAELEEFMNQQREVFEAKNAELAKLQQDYMTQQRDMNTNALGSVERTIQEKETELSRFREDAQVEFNDRQNKIIQRISGKIQVIIQEYAQSNSFDAIFMRDQNQIYVSPALDVTGAIIEIYNKQYPGTAAAAASPTSN